MADYVLVHGEWHGDWCWQRVAGRLRAAGHRVFTPTDHCTERVRADADAGARHIVLRIGALDPWPLLEQAAEIARRARSWN
jgi:hypothetical protein